MAEPNCPEVRSHIADEQVHRQSYWISLALFFLLVTIYCASFSGAITGGLVVRCVCVPICGISIAVIFVIGHDAGHRCYTPSRAVDSLITRVSLLPAYWPACSWRYGHNQIHHGFTLLKPLDYNWMPLTLDEYKRLSPTGQAIERHYKSWLGLASNWICVIWWRHGICPRTEDWRGLLKKPLEVVVDFCLVFLFFAGQLVILYCFATPCLAAADSVSLRMAEAFSCGVVVPFWISSFFIGLVAFTQHTHPNVVWFDNKSEWSFFRSQVHGTIHFRFPFPINKIFLNVMEHTAHHVDPSIPVYNLVNPQIRLEEVYPENVTVEDFSIATVNRLFRMCQLYDYRNKVWLDFSGQPTHAPSRIFDQSPSETEVRFDEAAPSAPKPSSPSVLGKTWKVDPGV